MDWAASVAGQGLGHGQKKSKLRVSSPVRPEQPTSADFIVVVVVASC